MVLAVSPDRRSHAALEGDGGCPARTLLEPYPTLVDFEAPNLALRNSRNGSGGAGIARDHGDAHGVADRSLISGPRS